MKTYDKFHYCIADLKANDWCLSDLTEYHGPEQIRREKHEHCEV